ncbi:unnamed protein product [Penicillium nalgiovense]|nr:unnamed protein product [Penicillium nalgiovense]CAG7946027.1 unnamed protein product [Penicillium nalgiovense]CAG7975195.1 unnamed protein product [Penicillium nalgiovense]CAG8019608.1 unnamed protein product [Penicillium nalgiovense]CAG8053984.1 unnamed protein product [Penicillium nalgiovense]
MASTSSAFNNARIRNHDDKVLLARINEYFEAFANADAKKMDSMVADDYRMSDIPLGIVRSSKEAWFHQNSAFSNLMTNISVEAISLHGSSEPGSFAVMENVVRFTLKIDPPEEAKANLPPGIKKGDSSGMIMLSTIWWNSDGKIARELEYGKLLWEGFDTNAFNTW